MGLLFFPRGGSAQVARYLSRSLPDAGWEVTVACGSLGRPGRALARARRSTRAATCGRSTTRPRRAAPDPLAADPPFHPSYEDRPGAPDRVFARVDDADYERLVATWERQLERAGAAEADVLHLHHLTPINEAAERAFPDVPRIGHLHGTELLMLREIDAGPPPGWDHAERLGRAPAPLGARLRAAAGAVAGRRAARAAAARRRPRARRLGAERIRAGRLRPPTRWSPARRLEHWRRWLVEDPRGWDESGVPGSVAYSERAARALRARPARCCSTSGASPRSSACRC